MIVHFNFQPELCAPFWQVNQKMILILTASIMYWSLQQQTEDSDSTPTDDVGILDPSLVVSVDGDSEIALSSEVSNLAINEAASDPIVSQQVESE